MKTKKMEESSFDLDMEAINATEEAKIIDKAEKETEVSEPKPRPSHCYLAKLVVSVEWDQACPAFDTGFFEHFPKADSPDDKPNSRHSRISRTVFLCCCQ